MMREGCPYFLLWLLIGIMRELINKVAVNTDKETNIQVNRIVGFMTAAGVKELRCRCLYKV